MLPSRDEPWGNVVAAAVKAGVPVVITETAALARELGATGIAIVVPDEQPAAIRSAISRILDDRQGFIDAVRMDEIVNRFGNVSIASRLVEAYSVAIAPLQFHWSAPEEDPLRLDFEGSDEVGDQVR